MSRVCFNSIFNMVARPSFFPLRLCLLLRGWSLVPSLVVLFDGFLFFLQCKPLVLPLRVSVDSSRSVCWFSRFLQSGNCFTWPPYFRPTDVEVLLTARSVLSVLAPSLSFFFCSRPSASSVSRTCRRIRVIFFSHVYLISFYLSMFRKCADFPVPRIGSISGVQKLLVNWMSRKLRPRHFGDFDNTSSLV